MSSIVKSLQQLPICTSGGSEVCRGGTTRSFQKARWNDGSGQTLKSAGTSPASQRSIDD
jgi:hypothetical protein